MHLVLYLLILGCGLPSAMAQADDATPPPPPPVDQSSTPSNTMDVQQVYNTTVGSTLSPDPGSNSTHLNITLSDYTTAQADDSNATVSNATDSNATDSSMVTTPIYTPAMTTVPVPVPPKTPAPTKKKGTVVVTLKPDQGPDTSNSTVTVIIILLIVAAVVIGAACFLSRKRSRRYSVDLRAGKHEEADVPLSTVEPEGAADSSSRNGMQSFAGTTAGAPDPTPMTDAEKGEEEKADSDKPANDSVPDPSPASSPAPSPPSSPAPGTAEGDKPGEQAPVEETSESLKEPPNVNNNNNFMNGPAGGRLSRSFSHIPQDNPA